MNASLVGVLSIEMKIPVTYLQVLSDQMIIQLLFKILFHVYD